MTVRQSRIFAVCSVATGFVLTLHSGSVVAAEARLVLGKVEPLGNPSCESVYNRLHGPNAPVDGSDEALVFHLKQLECDVETVNKDSAAGGADIDEKGEILLNPDAKGSKYVVAVAPDGQGNLRTFISRVKAAGDHIRLSEEEIKSVCGDLGLLGGAIETVTDGDPSAIPTDYSKARSTCGEVIEDVKSAMLVVSTVLRDGKALSQETLPAIREAGRAAGRLADERIRKAIDSGYKQTLKFGGTEIHAAANDLVWVAKEGGRVVTEPVKIANGVVKAPANGVAKMCHKVFRHLCH